MRKFVSALLLLSMFTINAQHKLLLKSGTYDVPSEQFLHLQKNGPTYGVVLWDHVVRGEDKTAAAELGIQLYNYLPKNAFEARIPAGIDAQQLKNAGISSFLAWSPRMKLDGPLANEDMPQWAVMNDGNWAVQFQTSPEYNATFGRTFLQQVSDLGQGWYSAILAPEDLQKLATNPYVLFVQAIEEPGRPENMNSRASARTQYVQAHTAFDGSGVVVGIGDDGEIGPHADYKGRLTSIAGANLGDHGDHVAGTVFGAGNIDPTAQGNAPGAFVYYSSYPDNLNYVDAQYQSNGVRVTNSSYSNGCNAGYTTYSQQVDQDVIQNPALIHVFSAGNSNGSNCGYGAGTQWGNITGGHKQGKNVIATANVTATDQIAPSSSRGPAADGRIKPDLAAVGTSVYSTTDPNDYTTKTGTSMASPGAAGFFAVLHNAYDSLQGNTAPSGLLKAIAMNTAEDLGNAGPDYIYGYGRLNARRALHTIAHSSWYTDTVSSGDTSTFTLSVPAGTKSLRAMLYWTDPQGSLSALRALVNDLDLQMVQQNSGTTYLPWVLDPSPNTTSLNSPAVRAVDSLNNAEQITLVNPSAGDYTFKILGSNIPSGPQVCHLVYYLESEAVVLTQPATGQKLTPGTTFVHWDQVGNATPSFAWSTDGSNWTTLNLTPFTGRDVAQWNVPNVATSSAYFRIAAGGDTSIAGPFTIISTPSNIQLDWACPDSIRLSFQGVSGATSYSAYVLGTTYMDSLATDTNTAITVPWVPTQSTWVSISANVGAGAGQRAYAVEIPAGVSGCPVAVDASVDEILSPTLMSACFSNLPNPTIIVRNPSTSMLDTVIVAVQLGSGAIQRDTLAVNLAPYGLDTVVLGTGLTWTGTQAMNLKIWTELSGDMNALNDTVVMPLPYLNTASYSLTFTQDFDAFSACGTNTNCGATVCNLSAGWTNAANGSEDDIDWRTNSGSTASSNTGPSAGYGGSGNYLYLESSNCFDSEAILRSPCIDLQTAVLPELSFAYHMYGTQQGSLEVQIFDGSTWTSLATISGNQGSTWNTMSIDLSAYAGNIVLLKFVGTTGNGYLSDIAIDQITIEDQVGAPEPNFTVSNTAPCLGADVKITDISAKNPSTWNWAITPSTFTFVNGTSSSSQHPEIQFNSFGTYTITLIAGNSYGTDTITYTNMVTVAPLSGLPAVETWHSGAVANWFELLNPDNSTTWALSQVINATGAKSNVAYMGYYNYSVTGERDALRSPTFSIAGYSQPVLLFDVAYAPYSNTYSDTLRVLVSDNCGNTFNTLYDRGGSDLATQPNSQNIYVPGSPTDWRTDTVDLSSLSGTDIAFILEGANGYGNNLYLDNVRVIDLGGTSSNANLDLPAAICEDHPFSFGLTSADTTLGGLFTLNRIGSNVLSHFNGLGTHSATLNLPTEYGLEYIYYNAYTFVADSVILTPGAKLIPAFSIQGNGLSYNFTDQSTPAPTAWFWNFGDGTTSTLQNPSHTFQTGGVHSVTLVVETDCGTDSTTITYSEIGLDELDGTALTLYPNPTRGIVHINTSVPAGPMTVRILNMNGQLIEESQLHTTSNESMLDLSHLPKGVVQIEIRGDQFLHTEKVVLL